MEINEKSFNMTEMDTEEQSSLFNLQNILMTFALHWKWFIPSVVICLLQSGYCRVDCPSTLSSIVLCGFTVNRNL